MPSVTPGGAREGRAPLRGRRGFTLVEIMIGLTLLVVGVLGVASMFSRGYSNVGDGGRLTMAVTAGRQMLEDVRLVPFAQLPNLNGPTGGGFRTDQPATLPAGEPERTIARKWRYALAGADATAGWAFSSTETQQWGRLLSGTRGGAEFGAVGQITVVDVDNPVTLRQVTVTITDPSGTKTYVQLQTLISRP